MSSGQALACGPKSPCQHGPYKRCEIDQYVVVKVTCSLEGGDAAAKRRNGMRSIISIAGSPHECEMSGDTRREDEKRGRKLCKSNPS